MIEKLLWKPVFSRLPSFFMHLYTMFFVILGWGIFSWQDMADGTNYFKTLFGISGNFVNREAMYLLSSYLILLVIAIIGFGFAASHLYKPILFAGEDHASRSVWYVVCRCCFYTECCAVSQFFV